MACISISNDVISKMRSEVDGGLLQSLIHSWVRVFMRILENEDDTIPCEL
ncbi:BnaA02g07260D [Brassica napus]|uniref:(rape) hypothetical protein n=1 Tax=Brassica napus TaxID=3708 RepID=A0A078H5D8_BRANA|nr:unnamed protein product [Brassica napus]CDY32664.1 BnaA02g07260D [Brassica napus]